MSTTEDRILYPPADSALAVAPHRVLSAERMGLAQAERRLTKARRRNDRLVDQLDFNERLIATYQGSIRRWSAAHAAMAASRHRWQTATWVTVVLALGYVLVYTHVGR